LGNPNGLFCFPLKKEHHLPEKIFFAQRCFAILGNINLELFYRKAAAPKADGLSRNLTSIFPLQVEKKSALLIIKRNANLPYRIEGIQNLARSERAIKHRKTNCP
jgi:hypothetical protein